LTAIALLLVYGAYLIFQLGTHQDLFSDGEDEAQHEPLLTLTAAFLWLAGITVVVAFLSEYLTGSLESVSRAGPTAVCCCWPVLPYASGTRLQLSGCLTCLAS